MTDYAQPLRRRAPFAWSTLLTHLVLIVAAIAVLLPVVWMIGMSFQAPRDVLSSPLNPIPSSPTIENYLRVLVGSNIAQQLGNSLVFAGGVTLCHLAIAIPAAFALAHLRVGRKGALLTAIAVSMSIPYFASYLPNFLLFAKLDALNTYAALILPQIATGYGILLLHQRFKSFPVEVMEAARIDGATDRQTLLKIILPTMGSPILSVALFMFISTWNELIWPQLVASESAMHVLTVGLSQYSSLEGGTNYGPIMAAAALTALPTLLLFLIFRKRILSAAMEGAIR